MFDKFLKEFKYAVRALNKGRTIALAAIITLSLGIGSTTAIFSLVKTVILSPLAFAQPNRLVMVWEMQQGATAHSWVLPANFQGWKDQSSIFEQTAAIRLKRLVLTEYGDPAELSAELVSPNYFNVLGIHPIFGRTFLGDENEPDKEHVVVIGNKLWLGQFGGDPNLIGKSVALDGKKYEVIGVVPSFYSWNGQETQIWVPFDVNTALPVRYLNVVARLQHGVSIAQAQAKMNAIYGQLAASNPEFDRGWRANVIPLTDQILGDVKRPMIALLLAVTFVLLIACANVANIQLVRVLARRREIAIQRALGASRWSIMRQLLLESSLLSALGGLCGLALAYWGIKVMMKFGPANIPRLQEASLDPTVLVFSVLLSIATGLAFGIGPAIWAIGEGLTGFLKDSSTQITLSASKSRIRDIVVTGEIMFALVLLVGAGLTIESFGRLYSQRLGFDPEHLLTFKVNLPLLQYRSTDQKIAFYRDLAQRVNNTPGVRSVAMTSALPADQMTSDAAFSIVGRPPDPGSRLAAAIQVIGADYFDTMHVRLISGRNFSESEMQQLQHRVIVNNIFVRRFFPHDNPIGQHLLIGNSDVPQDEIIGVSEDVHQVGFNAQQEPVIYWPYNRLPFSAMSIVVSTSLTNPEALAPEVIKQIHSIDPNQPVTDVMSMDNALSRVVSRPRFTALLFSLFAGSALILAAFGIYSILAYNVRQNTRAIGVRLALGAKRTDVLRMILSHGLKLALFGVLSGLILSALLVRFIAGLLFGTKPLDPLVFAGVSFVLLLVSLLASLIPANRASKVDPNIALHYE